MQRIVRGTPLAAAILLIAASAHSEVNQRRDACLNKETPSAQLIAACTELIEGGREKGATLATAHANRAEAYRETGELDKAIASFDRRSSSIATMQPFIAAAADPITRSATMTARFRI